MKILIVLSRVPYKLDKGDKLRAFHQIKELSKNNEIILFAVDDKNLREQQLAELKKYCAAISVIKLPIYSIVFNLLRAFFKGMPLQVGYFYNKKAQEKVDELIKKHQPNHIYAQLIRTTEYVKNVSGIPKTLDYMDVFSKGMERRKHTESTFLRPIFSLEHKRLIKYEKQVFDCFEHKTIISEQDKKLIQHSQKQEIHVVPNGVDTDYFMPVKIEKEYEILFNGNMDYPPNVESVEFLVNKILPLVWEKKPEVRLLISGSSPNAKVLRLQSERVVVSGWVDDIRENFAISKMMVAPMQISIGLQNKLLEAMAMQIPCITSTLANNALGAKNMEQIIVADSPEQYAAFIVELLEDENKANKIALNGYKYIIENFNWTSTVKLLEGIFEKKE